MGKIVKTATVILTAAAMAFAASGCGMSGSDEMKDYGVFLGAGPEDMDHMKDYRTVVIDAQYFTAEDISELKDNGQTVLSYINLGSLEDFRPYYNRFYDITLSDYENWNEERWVDVTQESWQDFLTEELAPSLMEKGIDGLFVDNVDVYWHYDTDEVFDAITRILTAFRDLGAYVSVNGGDAYVNEYMARYRNLPVIDCINQETVFSSIDFDNGTFGRSSEQDRYYYQSYLTNVSSRRVDVCLLEYTTDPELIREIDDYCSEHGYRYYVSSTLELLAG